MMIRRRKLLATAAAGLATPFLSRAASASDTIRFGVLTDLSSLYSDGAGNGSVVATRLAAEDFMKTHPDIKVEVLAGDMQSSPDIGLGITRSWFDRADVDAVSDVPNSAVALALSSIVIDKDKVALLGATGSPDLTGKSCSPNLVQWTYDSYCLATSTARAICEQGRKKWFFITADYAYGKSLTADASRVVLAEGGQVVGNVLFPFLETTDFGALLVQAQASGADAIALAMAGGNTNDCIKQAHEFGVTQSGPILVGLTIQETNVNAIGLDDAQGLSFASPFYWDLNDGTRAFSARIVPLNKGIHPTWSHAGAYADAWHYLKAVAVLGVSKAKASGRVVVEQMKSMPTDDPLFGKGYIRKDGRKIHDVFQFQVKTPQESHYPWDYYKVVQRIPGDEAFRPMKGGGCPFISG